MTIRVAEEKDVQEIVDLLVTVFPHRGRSRRHWDWSHSDDCGLAVVAEHEGRVVGHYSFGYQPFKWRGRAYTAGFGQQAAVHPGHRDLRTIVELIRFAEQAVSGRCDFVFAFPNPNMAPVKERVLGWEKVLTFPALTLPVAEFGGRIRGRTADRYSVRRLTMFSGLDCSCFVEADAGTLTPVRGAEWFEWRYIAHPQNHYACFGAFVDGRCEGLTVLKAYFDAEDRRGHVLELHGRDFEAKLCLLSAAADYFEFMGVDQPLVWGQDKHNRPLYENLGFAPSGIYSTLYAKPLNDDARDITTADWSFDMGVSDVF